MCPRTPRFCAAAIVFTTIAFLCPSRPALAADDDDADGTAAGLKLLAEGDRQAAEGKTDEASLTYTKAFERILPGLRKLPFKAEVKANLSTREDLGEYLIKTIDEELPPAKMRAEELGMKALGLVPPAMDLKQTLVRMLTEEVAGFYDAKTEQMHLIREAPPPAGEKPKKPGLLDKLFGREGPAAFDKDQIKGILAHELTHALADQYFDLDAMHKKTGNDGDRELALSALIEGEATLTMIAAMGQDWKGDATAKMPASQLNTMVGLLGPFMVRGSGKALREAPPILSETLIFPYLKGVVFCATLTNAGGWDAIDAAYAEPPLSTEQILHPEKYNGKPAERDAPTAVDLGALKPAEGWTEVTRNTLGELATSIMLRDHKGRDAAAGWDGDSYAVFEGPGGKLGLVWMTTWDSEDEAREFAAAYAPYQARKLTPNATTQWANAEAVGTHTEEPVRRKFNGTIALLQRVGRGVAIVEGFDASGADTMLAAALKAKKAEKTHDGPTTKPN